LALAESYFDETNTNSARERLCIAGYVFEKENAKEQAARWQEMLEKWGLPYFHMVDCAHHADVYAHLSKKECDLAARDAIQIIKETASIGVGITVLESEFKEIIPNIRSYGRAYDACTRHVIAGVSKWINSRKFEGSMHYFFESGVSSESNASYCIAEMMNSPEIRKESRYSGHTFIKKTESAGIQAADVLAWHAGQDCKRALRGDPIRKDFQSLLDIPHDIFHLEREILLMMRELLFTSLREADLTIQQANNLELISRRTGGKSETN
jgi:hypothetical protein